MIGWVLGPKKLRFAINANSSFKLGSWFDVLIKYVIPGLLGTVLVWNIYTEFSGDLYGSTYVLGGMDWIPYLIPVIWLVGTLLIAYFLTFRSDYDIDEDEDDINPLNSFSETQ